MKQVLNKLRKVVEKNFAEQVELVSRLVKAKSANPYTSKNSPKDVGIEKEVAEILYQELERFKLNPQRRGVSQERYNVVGFWGDKRGRKSLILNGHMDTIMPNEKAVINPYSGLVRGNKLYGLGALDMKATLSAYVYAVKALVDLGVEVRGGVWLWFVVDEESGACSRYGTRYLLEQGLRAKAAIIGEPGTKTIGIGHRGGYRFKLNVYGESVHTGVGAWERKERGRNAAVDMAKAIEVLQNLDIPFKPAKNFVGRKPVFTFPTILRSGHAVNVVPELAEAYGDVRLMPGNSEVQVKMLMVEKLQKLGIKFDIEDLLFVPAVEIEAKEEIVEVLQEEAKLVLGREPVVRGVGSWNDAWMLIKRDIPTICGFGPNGGNEHREDEYVDLKSLQKVTEVYARVILKYLS